MDYHVSTPAETALVMQTADGRVVLVLPAPPSSLPSTDRHLVSPPAA